MITTPPLTTPERLRVVWRRSALMLLLLLPACSTPAEHAEERGVPEFEIEDEQPTAGVFKNPPGEAEGELQDYCDTPVGILETGDVVDVTDGDTIDVEIEGELYRVRYIGIDTPERDMAFYDEATKANAALDKGQRIFLERDVRDTDRYDRLLRYIYTDDGAFVNAELISNGYAQAATFPPDVKCADLFSDLESQAREEGAGLWSEP